MGETSKQISEPVVEFLPAPDVHTAVTDIMAKIEDDMRRITGICEMIGAGSNAARYLIRKRGLWYRPNSRGYTTSAIQAGRYTRAEAENITHPNGLFGPRDDMSFVHEDECFDVDWKMYCSLAAQRDDALAREAAQLETIAKLRAIVDQFSFYLKEMGGLDDN